MLRLRILRFAVILLIAGSVMINVSAAGGQNNVDLTDWNAVVEAARQEGELNLAAFGGPTEREFLEEESAKRFTQEYGIKVKYSHGAWFDTLELMRAEASRTAGSVDIALMWSKPWNMAYKEGLLKEDLTQLLPNAEFIDPKIINNADMLAHHGSFIPKRMAIDALYYNKRFLSEEDVPKSYDELLDFAKAHPGKFGYADPNVGGSGHTFLMSLIYWLTGIENYATEENIGLPFSEERADELWQPVMWDYLRELGKYTAPYQGQTGLAEAFAREEVWLIPMWGLVMASMIDEGRIDPDILQGYLPEPYICLSMDGLVMPKNAPNPNAALVYMNFMLSEWYQGRLVELGYAPARPDAWIPEIEEEAWSVTKEEIETKTTYRHPDYMFYMMQKWPDEVGAYK